jgi:hypothetical protein
VAEVAACGGGGEGVGVLGVGGCVCVDEDGCSNGDGKVEIVVGVFESYSCFVDVVVRLGGLILAVTYGCLQLYLLLLRWSFCWWDELLKVVRGLRLQWSRLCTRIAFWRLLQN